MQRTPDDLSIALSDAFLVRCFDIIADTKASLMLEARNKK